MKGLMIAGAGKTAISLAYMAAQAALDMQTLVIVGNSMSFVEQGRMVTPRVYTDKYGA